MNPNPNLPESSDRHHGRARLSLALAISGVLLIATSVFLVRKPAELQKAAKAVASAESKPRTDTRPVPGQSQVTPATATASDSKTATSPASTAAAENVPAIAPQPTEQQRRAFAQLQEILARQPASGQPAASGSPATRLGGAASISGQTPEAVRRKIQQHLFGASRDPGRAPSPDYYFQAESAPDGMRVDNPNHRLSAQVSAAGVTIRPRPDADVANDSSSRAAVYREDWQLGLELVGFGYEGAVHAPETGKVESRLNTLEHVRPGLTEWYVNTGSGLEQGFTFPQTPGQRPTSGTPLRLELEMGTGFSGEISPDGASLALSTSDGVPVLRYAGLLAFDATGRVLPSRMEFTGVDHVALVVDDRDAQYPVVVDPVIVGLVKDVNLNTDGSFPNPLLNLNGVLYFMAYEPTTGNELWKSDGTAAGTVMVKDIYAGSSSSYQGSLTAVGSTVYFVASDASTGQELWKSDGTSAGTMLVKDIYPGSSSSGPWSLTAVGSTLYFSAFEPTAGQELWKSDGTAAGTVLVKDIYAGTGGSNPQSLVAFGSTLYFSAIEPTAGQELWKSDGTAAGTVLVRDIYPGTASGNPVYLTAFGGTLYFSAADATYGQELWKSDGTAAGTAMIKDIYVGGNSSPHYLTAVGGTLYFSASSSAGQDVWKSDGTAAGTVLVADLYPGASLYQQNLTPFGNLLIFEIVRTVGSFSCSTSYQRELWRSDGTSAGTFQLRSLQFYSCNCSFGCSSTYDPDPTVVGSQVYFREGSSGEYLSKTDGTIAGTVVVRVFDSGSYPYGFVAVGNQLFFSAGGSNFPEGRELWRSDGTFAGTTVVKDINGIGLGSFASQFAVLGNALYFRADDGVTGYELWKSDGTAAGTVLVKDLYPGSNSGNPNSGNPSYLTVVGSTLYFQALESATGMELWKSDGTTAGTVLVKDIYPGGGWSSPQYLTAVGNTLFFAANDPTTGGELWKSDGTAPGTVLVKDIYAGSDWSAPIYLKAVGGTLYFSASDATTGTELWKSDGTTAGTVMVKDISPSSSSSNPQSLTAVGSTLYFSASEPTAGQELWKSDGTAAGTVLVKDIYPAANGSSPMNFTVVGATLYFSAFDSTTGQELWKSDGTTAGTVLVKDIYPGSTSSNPQSLTAVGSTLFFSANEPSTGQELWKSDGTTAGTVLVKDISSGSNGSSPQFLTAVGDVLFFSAQDPTSGRELWRSDGTAARTVLAADIWPGAGSSSPQNLKALGQKLFFTASDGQTGNELWYALDIPNLAPTGLDLAPALVPENQSSDTFVGLLTTTDPDADDIHTYALVSGDGDTDNSLFTLVGAELHTAAVFDFETQNLYSIRVRTTDAYGVSYDQALAIQVVDVNEAPVAVDDSYNLGEDMILSLITPSVGVLRNDTDVEGDTLTAVLVSSTSHGSLVLQPDGRFTYTPIANFNGPDSFTYKINDGTADSSVATVTINVIPVNDSPVANAQSVNTAEDSSKLITLTGSDVDGNALTFGMVSGPSHGSLSGTAPNLTYMPAANYHGPDNFTFTVSDGSLTSAQATVSITVESVNDAPVAVDDTYPLGEDMILSPITPSVGALRNDYDVDADTLTAVLLTSTTHGTVTLQPDGRFTYTPTENFNGPDTFTYKINDGTADSGVATVTINVTPVNDPPVVTAQSVTTTEDTTKAITLTGSDVDGDTLSFAVVTGPVHGTLTGAAPNLTYRPAAAYNGPDSFAFKVSDGTVDSATATVSITITAVNDAPVGVSDLIQVVEDTPTPIRLSSSDDEASGFIQLHAFTGADGSDVRAGVALGSDGRVYGTTYVGGSANLGVLFRVEKDGTGFSVLHDFNSATGGTAPVAAVIEGVDQQLYGTTSTGGTGGRGVVFRIARDGSGYQVLRNLGVGAGDGGNPLGALAQAADGTLFGVTAGGGLNEGGTVFSLKPNGTGYQVLHPFNGSSGAFRPTSSVLIGSDGALYGGLGNGGSGGAGALYRMQADGSGFIVIREMGLASSDSRRPIGELIEVEGKLYGASSEGGAGNAGSVFRVNLDGTGFAVLRSFSMNFFNGWSPQGGLLKGGDGRLYGTTQFGSTAGTLFRMNTDGSGFEILRSFGGNAGANPTGTLVEDANGRLFGATLRGGPANVGTVYSLLRESAPLIFTIVQSPTHGTLTGTAPALTYTPTANYNGSDVFTYRVNDGALNSFDAAISINVVPVNDTPVATAQSVTTAEDTTTAITLTGSDVESSALTFMVVGGPAHGTLNGTAPNLTYTPAANYHGADSFTFKVNDGTVDTGAATVSITVTSVNDAPVDRDRTLGVFEDAGGGQVQPQVDADGDPVSYLVVTPPQHGRVELQGGNLIYLPDANYNGPDSYTFKATDGLLESPVYTYTINVILVNDLPSATAQSLETYDSAPLAITLSGSDLETATLNYRIVSGPAAGALSGTPPNVVYTPPFPYAGNVSFTFEVKDADAATASATVNITVRASDRPPVANAGADITAVAGSNCKARITLDGSASSDPDGDALAYSWNWRNASGQIVFHAAGGPWPTWDYPIGTYTVELTVSTTKNGVTLSSTDTQIVTVQPGAPILDALNPAAVYANGPAFNLTVTGDCFLQGATVYWNGAPRRTTVVNSSEVVAAIPASDLNVGAEISVATVQVVNGDGQASNPLAFTIVAQTVGTVDTSVAASGGTATVSTAPTTAGDAGVAVVVQNNGGEPVSVVAATYDTKPTGETAFRIDNGDFVDVQINGADSVDVATVYFYYPSTITGNKEDKVKLRYFDGVNWITVLSSGGVLPVKDPTDNLDGTQSGGRFVVAFDNTSTPKITELNGTIFGMIDTTPQILSVNGPTGPLALGSSASLTVNYATPDAAQTCQVSLAWDDGSISTVTGNNGTATASHVFAGAGVYSVTVTVPDADGAVGSTKFEYVVIYDPSAGFVTGGGWFNSPVGAYAADPALTGKANFGFVSKYQKGKTVPTGETEFQFHVANFKFNSTVYEWLVVSSPLAQYKGSGTVNGAGDYGFLLTATDGQINGGGGVDKFRIKIWIKATGAVVYDNAMGSSDDINSANPKAIGGGSIVIQKAK